MRILIAVPCLDSIETEFADSLFKLNKIGITDCHFQQSSLVYDSRNKLAEYAVENEYDYVLWLDSDVTFHSDMLIDMMNDIKSAKGEMDAVCGLYFARRPNFEPCVWNKIRLGPPGEAISERVTEIPADKFEIDACGFGSILMKTEILKAVIDKNHDCFGPLPGYGEDLSFCIRARKLGFRLWCDPKIRVGHMARTTVTEETYKAWNARLGELDGDSGQCKNRPENIEHIV